MRVYRDEFYHSGIKGMHWGVRRYQNEDGTLTEAGKKRQKQQYHSTGLRAYIARKRNERVDASFKKWKEGAEARDNAIEIGKKATAAEMEYNRNPNKDTKASMKSARKAYKHALSKNTTYRKGSVREAVGRDKAKAYLLEARQISKQMKTDPENRQLAKKYDSYMSKHDVERAKAGRAQSVGATRSRRIASLKRAGTMAAKGAAIAGTAYVGLRHLKKYKGIDVNLSAGDVAEKLKRAGRVARTVRGFVY